MTAEAELGDQVLEDDVADLLGFVAETVAPAETLYPSQWAAKYRRLGTESPEAGQWRNERTPYLAEIMDRLSPLDPCETVVFQKAAQVGGTEVANNWIGWSIANVPRPFIVAHPSDEAADTWVDTRLDRLLETESIAERLLAAGGRSRGKGRKRLHHFAGGYLKTASAQSAKQLRQLPATNVIADDLDGFPPVAGDEGDPLTLLFKRASAFRGRKHLLVSTPTTKKRSRIERWFKRSDQRFFFVPCPHCGTLQALDWSGVRWEQGRPETAVYYCGAGVLGWRQKWKARNFVEGAAEQLEPLIDGIDGEGCGQAWRDSDKNRILVRGEWRPTADGDGGETVGYHLSALYAPFGLGPTWAAIAKRFKAAGRDPTLLQPIVNTDFAETWDERDGDELEGGELLDRREAFGEELSESIGVLTAGVDTQPDRLEVEVVGWGLREESWSVGYFVIWGDVSTVAPWDELDALLRRRWDHPLIDVGLPISCACVDTGGHNTKDAYDFVRPRHDPRPRTGSPVRVFGIKGIDGPAKLPWPKAPSFNNKGKIPLYTIGVDGIKDSLYGRLQIDEPGPGYCHFPLERDRIYFDQITAEVRRYKLRGGVAVPYWWLPEGVRNEALDCRVYATAALHAWYSYGRDIRAQLDTLRARSDRDHRSDEPLESRPRRQWLGRHKHWIKGRD